MGKAEEYLAKKRNKASRKRLNNTVDFTHGAQAAKQRRKAGRRRVCEGMCFSLPTLEDPFNDLYKEKLAKREGENGQRLKNNASIVKQTSRTAKDEKIEASGRNLPAKATKFEELDCNSLSKNLDTKMPHASVGLSRRSSHTVTSDQNNVLHRQTNHSEKHEWKPHCDNLSKKKHLWICVSEDAFEVALCALLNADMVKLEMDDDDAGVGWTLSSSKNILGSKWCWLFWETCGSGSDVLVTGQAVNTRFQQCGMLAAVGHIAARRASQTLVKHPIVVFIVQSKEHTLQVRSMFKVLKSRLGLHAVSLHPETSPEHQIEGLRSTKAEVLVATPQRLRELVAVNAVSLSNTSLMVVDGVEQICSCGFANDLIYIRKKVPDNVQVVLSSSHFPQETYRVCQTLLKDPIVRVFSNGSVPESCVCINQKVHVFVSEEKRQLKLKSILKDFMETQSGRRKSRGPLVMFQQEGSLLCAKDLLQEEGYSVKVICGDGFKPNQPMKQFRDGKGDVLLASEDGMKETDLAEMGFIVLYEFAASIESYQQILMRMARHTVNGVLHSLCNGATAPLASKLIKVLEDCLQPTPPSLRMLADAAQVVQQESLNSPTRK